MIYTLSIEDRVGRGVNCTERAVIVEEDKVIGGFTPFTCKTSYNPNKDTGAFKENGPYDTSFSIVHSLREVANKLARHCLANGSSIGMPRIKYDVSVNDDAQKTLFENIFKQSCHEVTQKTIKALELGK